MLGAIILTILVANPLSALPLPEEPSAVQQPAASAGQTAPDKPWPPAGVFRPGAGVTAPRMIKSVKAGYTGDAMRAGIEGVVWLQAIVQTDGTVGEVRVTRSLDHMFGLDDECVKALKQWLFTPGTKDGVAVRVLVDVEMTFTIRKKS
jgi:TonB family protein